VRAWIARHGGLTPKMMYLRGRDLAAIVAPCNSSRAASVSRAKRFGGVHQVADTNTPRATDPQPFRVRRQSQRLVEDTAPSGVERNTW